DRGPMTSVWHRLLVIDDSLTIRKLVELSFRGAPFTLDFAPCGADGIARAIEGAPDVILLDCVLPDMKAADVCQRLERVPRGAASRIILMSAKARLAVQPMFDRFAQVFDFLGKPFTADDIRARVEGAAQARGAAGPAPEAPSAPRPADGGSPASHGAA